MKELRSIRISDDGDDLVVVATKKRGEHRTRRLICRITPEERKDAAKIIAQGIAALADVSEE